MANFMEKLTNQADINQNNLLSITQPPEFILKILIIQSRDNIKSAIEHYYSQKANGINPQTAHVKARIIGLYLEIRNAYREEQTKNNIDPDKYETELLETKDFNTLYRIRNELDTFLYNKKLIKFDNIVSAKNIAEHNRSRGYD